MSMTIGERREQQARSERLFIERERMAQDRKTNPKESTMEWQQHRVLIMVPEDGVDDDVFEYVMGYYEYNEKDIGELITFTWCDQAIEWGRMNNLMMYVIPPYPHNCQSEAMDLEPEAIIEFEGDSILSGIMQDAKKEDIPHHRVPKDWRPQIFDEVDPATFFNEYGYESLSAA